MQETKNFVSLHEICKYTILMKLKHVVSACGIVLLSACTDSAQREAEKQELEQLRELAEIEKAEAQLQHLEGFLASVRKKLSNEKFVAHAPEAVVAMERKKESDSLEKIAALKETIAALKG